MKQFGIILRFELMQYFKNKVFVGITVFLVALIAVVMCFPRIMNLVETEDPGMPEDKPIMLIKAEPAISEAVISAFSEAFPDYEVKAFGEDGDEIEETIVSGRAACAFALQDLTHFTYYVHNLTMYDSNTAIASQVLQHIYRTFALIGSGVTPEQVADIMAVVPEGETALLGQDQMENFFYTYIMIMALYMVILLYGQMVATNVATEKSSRAMEVLITSAKPTSMMFGKVFASCIAGLLQLISVFGSALVFYRLNQDLWSGNEIVQSIFNIPVDLLIYMLIFFVLGFFIYAFLYGAIGSTASKLEDINTSVMPLTFVFIIAFLVVMMSMSAGEIDNLAMRLCSFIPFTSPMAMFTRIAMSTVPWYEIAVSIGILILSVFGVGVISAKIYRVGVLLYGTPPRLSAIIKALRKS